MFVSFLHKCVHAGIIGVLGILLLASASPLLADPNPPPPYPTNNEPTNQIRFHTPAEADAKRRQLINYIWSDGLPTSTMPAVTANVAFPAVKLARINKSFVSRVDKLDANVSGMDFHAISYLIHPTNTANVHRLAIVQQGHSDSRNALNYGIGGVVNRLLQAGYSVIIMQMPLCGWNVDHTVNVPGGRTVTINGSGSTGHNEMFAKLGPPVFVAGSLFRFFLEPVVQNINCFERVTPNAKDVTMIGLSGGGWTTSMAAAVDTRIKLSIPVAGSAPLYIQNRIGSGPDMEQVYTPLYDERIAPDGSGGGVATWLEIYALGGYGAGRRQIVVTIPGEPVGLFPTTWVTDNIGGGNIRDILSRVMANLHYGRWGYTYDTSAKIHQISPWTVENAIMPAIAPRDNDGCERLKITPKCTFRSPML